MRKRIDKQKGKEKKGKKEQERKESVERKGRKRRKKKREKEDFPAFGRSRLDSSRTKVGARSGIYMWTPKSWSFDKLQEVGYFPTWFTFSLKAL